MLTPKNITLNRNFMEKNEIKDKILIKVFIIWPSELVFLLSVSKQINIFA